MKIKWLGHSCFLLDFRASKLRILIDPYRAGAYDGAIGYRPISDRVDVVLMTHDHPDHSGADTLPGKPLVVRGDAVAQGISFETLELAHDHQNGRLRGKVRAFLFDLEGIRICHLGDLGHELKPTHLEQFKGVQVLMIPVGGLYTINGMEAWTICKQIRPNLAIPMHYKTSKVAMDLEPVEIFLKQQTRVVRASQTTIDLESGSLPEPITTVVLTAEN